MERLIYHEKQESALCGQHCLNNLLQGDYFGVEDLAAIAQECDRRESQLYTRAPEEEGSNVALDGNFSIQVLAEALQNSHDLHLRPIGAQSLNNTEICSHNAFVCNLENHWFTVRKVDGVWFDLNSLHAQPEIVTEFYLSAFISQLGAQGYSIFVVEGELPPSMAANALPGDPGWLPISQLTHPGQAKRAQQTEEEMLQAAIAASLEDQSSQKLGTGSAGPDVMEVSQPPTETTGLTGLTLPDLPPEPEPGADFVVRVQLKLPSGKKQTRRFTENDTVGHVFAYARQCVSEDEAGSDSRAIEVCSQHPRLTINPAHNTAMLSSTLLARGLSPSASLFVRFL